LAQSSLNCLFSSSVQFAIKPGTTQTGVSNLLLDIFSNSVGPKNNLLLKDNPFLLLCEHERLLQKLKSALTLTRLDEINNINLKRKVKIHKYTA
jgi:hypothetical protein